MFLLKTQVRNDSKLEVNNRMSSSNMKAEQKPVSTTYLLNDTPKKKNEDIVYESKERDGLGQSIK